MNAAAVSLEMEVSCHVDECVYTRVNGRYVYSEHLMEVKHQDLYNPF